MATLTPISRKPLSLVLPIVGLVGLLVGLLVGTLKRGRGAGRVNRFDLFSSAKPCGADLAGYRKTIRLATIILFFGAGWAIANFALALLGGLIGGFTGWFIFWLYEGRYRAKITALSDPLSGAVAL